MGRLIFAALVLYVALGSTLAKSGHICKPRKTVLATHPNGKYHPYYLEVHRCSGGTQNPDTHRCWPTNQGSVNIHVMNSDEEKELVSFSNHTECREVCICGKCRKTSEKQVVISPAELCKPTERWDADNCGCKANCLGVTNPRSGKGHESFVSLKIFVIAMVVELIALVVVVLVFRRWLFYRREKTDGNLNCDVHESSRLTNGTAGAGHWSHGEPTAEHSDESV